MPKAYGDHTPHNGDPSYNVRFCPTDHMAISAEADRRGLPISAFLRMAVLSWLEFQREQEEVLTSLRRQYERSDTESLKFKRALDRMLDDNRETELITERKRRLNG